MGTKLRKFIALDASERLLLVCALRCLLAVRIGLFCLPFRFFTGARPVAGKRSVSPTRIVWAINAVAPFVPSAACLVRALATQCLFARHGIASRVRVGVTRPTDSTFAAHAWVECDDLCDQSAQAQFTTLITIG